ncbi:hypothetical protein V8B97DRAFT_1914264 [Scleroderma yunnanense]
MTGPIRSKDKSADSNKVQPPRPPNAWILYRSHKLRQLPPDKGRAQADVSKMISSMWKNESDSVRLEYERMADERKAAHQLMYPDYRFQPVKKEEKAKQREQQKLQKQRARADKKSKRDATSTASTSAPALPPPSTVPVMPPPVVYATPYGMPPGYTMMQMPYISQSYFTNEARFGPAGPSPPLSAAPSPPETEDSPSPLPVLDEQPGPSTSNSVRPLAVLESQGSSASQPLPANTLYMPQSLLPGVQVSPTNLDIAHPLPDMQSQTTEQAQWSQQPDQQQHSQTPLSTGSVPQLPPNWNHSTSAQLPPVETQNPQDFLNFDIGFPQNNCFSDLSQGVGEALQMDGLQDILSMSGDDGVFSLANFDPLSLVSHPQGELELAVGPQAQPYDYNGDLFANFDFSSLEHLDSHSMVNVTATNDADDLTSLFQTSINPDAEEYNSIKQRQPSMFTQDVMQFLNLEVAEGGLQDTTAMTPAPPTVAPQQVRAPPQPAQHAKPMPIFTQVTNAPVAGATAQYIPPAGAVNSSIRRVAGSWKPPVAIPESPVEQAPHPWDMSAS